MACSRQFGPFGYVIDRYRGESEGDEQEQDIGHLCLVSRSGCDVKQVLS